MEKSKKGMSKYFSNMLGGRKTGAKKKKMSNKYKNLTTENMRNVSGKVKNTGGMKGAIESFLKNY